MHRIQLGSTGITIEKNGFGALPIQRISRNDAVYLLRKALDGGINYFDTARAYTDSEEKLGYAFSDRRDRVVIATKFRAKDGAELRRLLEESLRNLQTDYIDFFQFHNPAFCPRPGGEDGLYDEALRAKAEGLIRHIGITNHRLWIAREAVESGLYETLQYPFSYLSGEEERQLVAFCREKGMGYIAMKGMAGGLIRDGYTAAAFMETQEDVVPIWGVQREWELDQFLDCVQNGAELTPERLAIIERDRRELQGEFCRGCGYCMPCPMGIQINQCARMVLMARRSGEKDWKTDYWRSEMKKTESCIHCNTCASRCPYGLDTPKLLEENYKEYLKILAES